jgi:hypothetical protein
MSAVYIILVNPFILGFVGLGPIGRQGLSFAETMTSTCLVVSLVSIVIGRYPSAHRVGGLDGEGLCCAVGEPGDGDWLNSTLACGLVMPPVPGEHAPKHAPIKTMKIP